MEEDQTAIKNE
jgi:hypothetical protein